MNTNASRSARTDVRADDLQLVALEAQYARRFDQQLTVGDTTLRAEHYATFMTGEACDQRSRARELPAETNKRPTSTRTDNPKDSFFRGRKSSGLREELLRSGRLIRHTRALLDVERRSHQAAMARARKFEEEQRERFFVFHARELERERDYHATMMAIRSSEADQLRELLFSSMAAMGAPEARIVETARATISENALAPLEQMHASSELALPVCPLTCVRVVGESRIPYGLDVLSLISSYLISMSIPIDSAVSRGAHHISAWLFANGKKPTERTAHVAVNTGCLAMVQLVFQHLQTPLSCGVFTELPIGSSAIAEWLMREYPAHMANEFTRISSSIGQRPQTQWARYIERLQRQWQWEDAIDEECWQRKRARLRFQ